MIHVLMIFRNRFCWYFFYWIFREISILFVIFLTIWNGDEKRIVIMSVWPVSRLKRRCPSWLFENYRIIENLWHNLLGDTNSAPEQGEGNCSKQIPQIPKLNMDVWYQQKLLDWIRSTSMTLIDISPQRLIWSRDFRCFNFFKTIYHFTFSFKTVWA